MRRPAHKDHGSHSVTDLMAGLAIAFLLLAAVFMKQERNQQHENVLKAETKHTVEAVDRAQDLLSQLEPILKTVSWKADQVKQVDTEVQLDLRLRFGQGSCTDEDPRQLTKAGAVLKKILDVVCRESNRHTDHAQLFFEGHTDNAGFINNIRGCGVIASESCIRAAKARIPWSLECCREVFKNNVRLSSARAEDAFFKLRDLIEAEAAPQVGCLDRISSVAGRGPLDPVVPYQPNQLCNPGPVPSPIDNVEDDLRVLVKVVFAHAVVESPQATGAP